MKIGISQLICANMSMAEFFQASKEAGYETVELSMKATGPLTGDVTPEQIEEIKALSKEYGLPISSMTINHNTGNLLDSGESQARAIEETAFGLEVAVVVCSCVWFIDFGSKTISRHEPNLDNYPVEALPPPLKFSP